MTAKSGSALRALFGAYVVLTFLHIVYVVNNEPFAFDAWNVAVDTHAEPGSLSRFLAFWHREYTTSNPRIGQPLTYFAYKYAGVAEIGTALAYLGIVLGGFVAAVRRWPDGRAPRDLAVLAIGIGFMWVVAPNLPAYMFCRAYATNYLWAAAIQLWFLVPLRLRDPLAAAPRPGWLLLYGLAGVAAGACNEHTGPTLVAAVVGVVAWTRYRHHRWDPLLIAGALGVIIGFAAIFFAPGQGQRYGEFLTVRLTLTEQIWARGVRGNLEILHAALFAAAPMLLVILTVVLTGLVREATPTPELREQRRSAVVFLLVTLLASLLIAATLFASPKLGPRFYIHGMLLVLAAFQAVVLAFAPGRRTLAVLVGVAVAISVYAGARTIPLYGRLAVASKERLAELAAAPRDDIVVVRAWEQVGESWWFLGDDFRDQKKRELAAAYFDLHRVLFQGTDSWAVLGSTDVRLVHRYAFEPSACLDQLDGIDLKPYFGRDVAALHRAFADQIADIRRSRPELLRTMDLEVTFLGRNPEMPRPHVFVARWRDGALDGYRSSIRRKGRTREVLLGPELQRAPWEIFMVALDEPPRRLGTSTGGAPLTYEPWVSGVYWTLACRDDHCFVTDVVIHRI